MKASAIEEQGQDWKRRDKSAPWHPGIHAKKTYEIHRVGEAHRTCLSPSTATLQGLWDLDDPALKLMRFSLSSATLAGAEIQNKGLWIQWSRRGGCQGDASPAIGPFRCWSAGSSLGPLPLRSWSCCSLHRPVLGFPL